MTRQNNLFILDVGSGHNPHPDADVLADAYLDNRQRADDLIVDRPFIKADIQNLPFKNNAFDFVNASQVVEHTENPYRAIAELERVGKSGQVDTPSYINENIMYGQEIHSYVMLSYSDSAKFVPSIRDGSIMHDFWKKSWLLRRVSAILDRVITFRTSRYYWGDGKHIHYALRKKNSRTSFGVMSNMFNQYLGEKTRPIVDRIIAYLVWDEVEKLDAIFNE